MKKIITLIAACGLLVGSCAKTERLSGDEAGTVKFKVNAVNSIKTRGDIFSSGDDGPIPAFAAMNVYAFLNNGSGDYLYTQTVDMIGDYNETTFTATRILADNTFPAGDYKFLGVGHNDGYTPTTPTPTTNFNDFSATIAAASNNTKVIFAGNVTQEVLATGATIEIDISRQVAGIFVYLTDIPTQIGGVDVAYLRLNITDANTSVNLITGDGSVAAGAAYPVISIPLTGQTVDTANNVYAGPGDSDGLDLVPNAQIESAYALPIDAVTMTMVLQDEFSNPLKTWNVVDSDGGTINLEPNVLLAIGLKNRADSEFGDDNTPDSETTADDTGTVNEDDKPTSLLTDETITVNVLRDWANVENLTIEEPQPENP